VTNLYDLGFLKDTIGETIVSTYDADGQPNAAPMGVVIESNERLLIRPYISSLTYRNLEVLVAETGSFSTERAEFLCNVKLVKASKKLPKVYCRAQFATIEAIIHATRIKPLLRGDKQEQKQAIRLLELVELCQDIVDRTAPKSPYSEIMADLTQRINSWRKESESLR